MRRTALRAALLTLGLTAAGLGLAAGPVEAAGCPDASQSCVVVNVVSTQDFKKTVKKYVFTADQIRQLSQTDLDKPAFYTRTKPGGKRSPTPRPAKALSLRTLLTNIGENHPEHADLKDDVTFSEAPDASGIPRVLDQPAFGDPNGKDFPFDDNLSPALYVSGGQIGYFRPLAGEDDVNGPDKFFVKGRLDLTIHITGKLLAPTATSSISAPTTKDKTKFSVSLSGKPGTFLKYRWDFGDNRGPNRGSKSPSHQYTKKGTYGAFVSVFGADGSYGRSAVLTVKVGKPPKAPSSPTTGSGGGVRGNSGGYVPPYNPPSTNLPAPAPDPIDEPLEDEPTEDIPVDDGLIDVEGYVLAGSEIVPGGIPEAIPGTQASSPPTPASETSVRKRIATWAVAALAIVLLVGAGATSETRWFRNRLHHFRRRA